MQKKSLETILYSSAGIVVLLALVVAVNVLTGVKPVRVDLTQEKAYTLSDGTRAVLRKLDTPVKLRFYCTQSENATADSVYLRNYARQVEDLLQEYQQVAGKNLIVEKYDPQPDSDAESSAQLDGLEPLPVGDEKFYLGISVSLADQNVALPYLDPSRDRQLEYDITRAIARVFAPEKPVVGVMSALPVMGEMGNPMMMQMGQGGGTPAWTLIDQLRQDYTVKRVELTADKIDDDIKVLLVIHPKDITDAAQFAIDQFVLRGGKLIAFLDPQSALSSRQQNPMSGEMAGASSSLDKLVKAWGLQFDTAKVVADLNFQMQLRGRDGQPVAAPTWLGLTAEGINTNDVVTSSLGSIWLPMCGAFTGEPVNGLKETVLLNSSKDSALVDAMTASMGASVMNGFKASGVNYKLAVRLQGKFPTAFPAGKPEDKSSGDTNAVAKADYLKESKGETTVVLVGDSDLLADDFSLRKQESPFGPMISELNANLSFAQNLVEQMAGDSSLIGVRSRATLNRPFTLIKKLEAEAEARGQAKIDELQQSMQETQQRLAELQQQKQDKDQRFILSPEQKTELENFRKKQAETGKELTQARKDLRKEVVSLENRLTWLNILGMPAGVALAGISIAVIKRKKTSAK
jgi:ABC-type uncharacterized transport system involved in gliding motility auxiliary subunit